MFTNAEFDATTGLIESGVQSEEFGAILFDFKSPNTELITPNFV